MNYIIYSKNSQVLTAYQISNIWNISVIDSFGSETRIDASDLMLAGILSAITTVPVNDDITEIVETLCKDTKYEARS